MIQGVLFFTGTPLKVLSAKKLIWARLGVSRPIYVNVDTPNLGFPYFNFLGGYQLKKHPVCTRRVNSLGAEYLAGLQTMVVGFKTIRFYNVHKKISVECSCSNLVLFMF